jgi:hypothetical protein
LSETGIEWGFEWSKRRLDWTEIASMRELRWGLLPSRRMRVLAIRTIGDRKGTAPNRLLFRSDFTINISGLEQPAEAALDLVEQLSGRRVERAR